MYELGNLLDFCPRKNWLGWNSIEIFFFFFFFLHKLYFFVSLQGVFLKDSNSLGFYNVIPATIVSLALKERGGRKK